MIETRDKEELIDYLVRKELVDPAYRNKLIKSPYGPLRIRQDTENGFKCMQLFFDHGELPGTYRLSGFTARIVKYPPYLHLVSQHMSTADLEGRMAAVDWNKESYKILKHLPNPVDTVFNDALFLRLAGNGQARDIADVLLLKYCGMTPAMNMLSHDPYNHPFVKTINVELNYHIRDFSLSQAWSLLEGRAVMKFNIPGDKDSAAWHRYNGSSLQEFPQFDLPGILSAVPFIENHSYEQRAQLYLQLINGGQISVKIKSEKRGAVSATLEADPDTQSIVGKDNSGNTLRFDKATPHIRVEREDFKQPPAKKKNKRNGRSL